MRFADRTEAGRALAARLTQLKDQRPVILALPRGGVPVGAEVAEALDAPLDVIVVRKLGVPGQPELAMGALGEGGVRVLDEQVLRAANVGPEALAAVEARERVEVDRRLERYRAGRGAVRLSGRTAIVVDDGVATGSTARAACAVARAAGAARVVLAVPVASPRAVAMLRGVADDVVAVQTPGSFDAIGEFYQDFRQTSDAEVTRLLLRARPGRSVVSSVTDVEVDVDGATLPGRLAVPPGAAGVVAFAHGSGSSRHSPRNRRVATTLAEAGLGILLFDLLTHEEERDRRNVFRVDLLGARLTQAVAWLRRQQAAAGLPVGLFGASTGAAAALWAAAEPGVAAVVSRGGRPDLAAERLPLVPAPTLLIVGAQDHQVLALNRHAQSRLTCVNRLVVVPGASHLFEEPGTLEQVAGLARDWFLKYLAGAARTAA